MDPNNPVQEQNTQPIGYAAPPQDHTNKKINVYLISFLILVLASIAMLIYFLFAN